MNAAAQLTELLRAVDRDLGGEMIGLRPWPIFGDMMEPTLKRGDMVLCRPVMQYEGFGYYVIGHGEHGGSIYKVDRRMGGKLRLMPENPRYGSLDCSREDFASNVMARVEYAITALGGKPVPGVLESVQASWRARS